MVSCQYGNNYGYSYGGTPGIAANSGVLGGCYNSYAQNTQAYSNQVAAVNYSPYAAYQCYSQTPANWGNSYGSAYSYPYYGLGIGYGCAPYACGRWC